MILDDVPVLWVVQEDGIVLVVGGKVPERESVVMEVEEPAWPMTKDWVVADNRVDASVLSEDAGTRVDVCTIVELCTDASKADMAMLPGE